MRKKYQDENSEGKLKVVLQWIVDLVVVAALAVFFVQMFGTRITMQGKSMEPTIANTEVVLEDRMSYHFTSPKRMDVIVFHSAADQEKQYIKRIVGMPGETVQIKEGVLFINGSRMELPTSELISLSGRAEEPITLSEDEYFVLGDCSETSEDSRFANIGNITLKQIDGKIWFRISPFDKMKRIR